jgi:hypothetical protein
MIPFTFSVIICVIVETFIKITSNSSCTDLLFLFLYFSLFLFGRH